jgi:predicted nucleic acid-binding protein
LTRFAIDTSVAVPLVLQSHSAHADVSRWSRGHDGALSGHAAAETSSVLTRLPDDARLLPADAARLLAERFSEPLTLTAAAQRSALSVFARLGIAGGMVYDALVAMAAAEAGLPMATRDLRARTTYELCGVSVEVAR